MLETYEGERVAQQHKAGCVIRQLVCNGRYVRVYLIVDRPDLQCFLVNLVCVVPASALL